jgi:hypothetical protein
MAVIEAIATTYLEADAASVTFSSIPATYEHLQLRANTKCIKSTGSGAVWNNITVEDASGGMGANYYAHTVYARSSTVSVNTGSGATKWDFADATSSASSSAPSAWYGSIIVDILDYTNTNKNTTIMFTCGNSTGVSGVSFGSGMVPDTDTIVSLTFGFGADGDTLRGSEFTLYGLNSS